MVEIDDERYEAVSPPPAEFSFDLDIGDMLLLCWLILLFTMLLLYLND